MPEPVPTSVVPAAQENVDLSPYEQVAREIAAARRERATASTGEVRAVSIAEAARNVSFRRVRRSA